MPPSPRDCHVPLAQPGTVKSVDVRRFDGQDWEGSYAATGIAACSKGGAPEPPAGGGGGGAVG
jgi:hypothetical protein